MRRVLAWGLVVVLLVGLVGLGAGGWYYSDQLLPAPLPPDPEYDVEVVASDATTGTIELATTSGDLVDLRTVGLRSPDGLVVLAGDAEVDGDTVTRTGALVTGAWPEPGTLTAASVDTYAGDPAATLGLPFEAIDIHSELGRFPAWQVVPNGSNGLDTWVVLIHGRGGSMTEGNRLLPTFARMGLPTLSISVRNDPDAPVDPDGYGRYGQVEWEDLQAAIDHLQNVEGAQRFILVGFSQGGSIAMGFLRHSADADAVAGAVLISPLLSLHETLVLQAQNRDIPDPVIPPLLAATRLITTLRAGLDFSEVEHVQRADELPAELPLLVTHGSADTTVPVGPSRDLAAALPDRVAYIEYGGIEHVREWNSDRERFEADLQAFVETGLLAPTG